MKQYYDRETGEYLGNQNDITYLESREYISSKYIASSTYKQFFMLVAEYQENLKSKYNLSLGDMGRLFAMMAHAITRNEGKLYMRNGNTLIKTNKDMAVMLQINEEQCRNFRKRLRKEKLLFKDSKGYYLSDDIVIRGKINQREKNFIGRYIVFSQILKDLYRSTITPNYLRSAEPFGLLMALIPFIQTKDSKSILPHGSNNMLCLTREEEGKILPVNYKYISEQFNIQKTTAQKHMRTLNDCFEEHIGLKVFYTVILSPSGQEFDEKKIQEYFIINPRITYSQGTNTALYDSLIWSINNSDGGSLPYHETE